MALRRIVDGIEVLVGIAAVLTIVLLFTNQGTSTPDTAGTGAVIFATSCATCHGADGGGGIGPALADGQVAERFPDFNDVVAIVTEGRGSMPAFGGQLTPDEIALVVQFLRSDLGS